MVVMDEFSRIITGKSLFAEPEHGKTLQKFVAIIKRCKANKGIENCRNICLEFNINKYTWMYDGESIFQ